MIPIWMMYHKATRTLPSLPSRILALALHDLELCRKSETYDIDMRRWHQPEDGKCVVCLAGCSMAQTKKVSPDEIKAPYDLKEEDERKLVFLEYLRQGGVGPALSYLGYGIPLGLNQIEDIPDYCEENYEKWLACMNKILKALRAQGW